MLPFIAGMALAYFLDPVADRLEKIGASRMVATVVILFVFVLIFLLFLMILVPILANQDCRIPQPFTGAGKPVAVTGGVDGKHLAA